MSNKTELTILGCASASPTANNFPTAQHLHMSGRSFLLDCGEGTQMQLRKYKLSMSRISAIFISHLHGDHFFGLPGLISSFHLMGRESELEVYGPKGLGNLVFAILRAQGTWLKFPIKFIEVEQEGVFFQDEQIEVSAVAMDHRIECWGYVFREKAKKRKLIPRRNEEYGIPIYKRDAIKRGEDLKLDDGHIIPNAKLTKDPDPSTSYAFFSDTAYQTSKAKLVSKVDLLYHESTFAAADLALAEKTLHSTSDQAAQFAKDAEVKQLLIGHLSGRYKDGSLLLEEAKAIFENTILANEGLKITW